MGITLIKAPGGALGMEEQPSSIELYMEGDTLPEHPISGEPMIPSGSTFTFVTNSGTFTATTSSDMVATFVDDLASLVITFLIDEVFGSYYNISLAEGSTSDATILLEAPVTNPSYDFISTTLPTGIVAENNTPSAAGLLTFGVFTKNDYDFIFQTNSYITDAGQLAFMDLLVAGNATAGQTLNLVSDVANLVFTFNNSQITVDANDNYILSFASSTALEQANKIIEGLRQNFHLDSNYKVRLVGVSGGVARVRIEGRNVEVGVLNLVSPPTNITQDSNTTDPELPEYAPNYRMFLDVYKADGTRVVPLDGIPDKAQQCNFRDIPQIFRSLTGRNIPLHANAPTVSILGNAQGFYLKACDYYGSTPSARKYKQYPAQGLFMAFNGAAAQNRITDNYLVPYLKQTVKFLTTLFSGKASVSPDQHQFLSFFLSATVVSNIYFKIKLHYTDDTQSGWLTIYSDHQTAQVVYTLNVGYDQLGIDGLRDSNKTVSRYDVCVFSNNDNSTAYTEVFTFKVDHNYYRNNRHFIYLNSFGMPESLWIRGTQENSIDVTATEQVHPYATRNESGKIYTGTTLDAEVQFENSYKIASGTREKWELDYIKDFFASENKYQQLPDKYQGIVTGKNNIDLGSDDDTLFTFEFNYRAGSTERGNA